MAWSFSGISAYRTCPRQYFETRVEKNFQSMSNPQSEYGTRGHLALEERVRDKTPLPAQFAYLEGLAAGIERIPGDLLCEHELACTREYAPAPFDSPDAWARGIVDVLVLHDDTAIAIDYKFGKVKPTAQLQLMALLVFANFPLVKRVTSRFLWIAHQKPTSGEFKREDAAELWKEFHEMTAQLDQSCAEGLWPENPSGLCKKHCPVATCEYYQRGRRY